MLKHFIRLFRPERTYADTLWHRCGMTFGPRRTVDGGWTMAYGKTWRRWNGRRWEYKHDPETIEEFNDRV